MQEKIWKILFVSEIIASAMVVLNCPYEQENTESVISEIHQLRESSFFKCSKFTLDFKKGKKIQKNCFVSQITVSELVAVSCLS